LTLPKQADPGTCSTTTSIAWINPVPSAISPPDLGDALGMAPKDQDSLGPDPAI
jgi:hypothetical protein